MFKWFDNLIDKILEYLPDEDCLIEEEKAYEEGKQRVYDLHLSGRDLFYAEEAWQEQDGTGKVYGEIVKGVFRTGDIACLYDQAGLPLMELSIDSMEKEQEENVAVEESAVSESKVFLSFHGGDLNGKEDIFARTFYIMKKETSEM